MLAETVSDPYCVQGGADAEIAESAMIPAETEVQEAVKEAPRAWKSDAAGLAALSSVLEKREMSVRALQAEIARLVGEINRQQGLPCVTRHHLDPTVHLVDQRGVQQDVLSRKATMTTARAIATLPSRRPDKLATRLIDLIAGERAQSDYFLTEAFGRDLIRLCQRLSPVAEAEPRLLLLQSPLYVVGPVRGNLEDLLFLADSVWPLGVHLTAGRFMFLGGYAGDGTDASALGLRCLAYLFALKLAHPGKVFMLRGAEEIRGTVPAAPTPTRESKVASDCSVEEEEETAEESTERSEKSENLRSSINNSNFKLPALLLQCTSLFGEALGREVWEEINGVFDRLPLAAVVDHDIFCSHGGIPPPLPGSAEATAASAAAAAAAATAAAAASSPASPRNRLSSRNPMKLLSGRKEVTSTGSNARHSNAGSDASAKTSTPVAGNVATAEPHVLQEIMSLPSVLKLEASGSSGETPRQLQLAQSLLGIAAEETGDGPTATEAAAEAADAAAVTPPAAAVPAAAGDGGAAALLSERAQVDAFLNHHSLSFACRGRGRTEEPAGGAGVEHAGVSLSHRARVFTVGCSPPRRAADNSSVSPAAAAAVVAPGSSPSRRPLSLGRMRLGGSSHSKSPATAAATAAASNGSSSGSPVRQRPWSLQRKRASSDTPEPPPSPPSLAQALVTGGNGTSPPTPPPAPAAAAVPASGGCGCLLVDFHRVMAVGRAPGYQKVHHRRRSNQSLMSPSSARRKGAAPRRAAAKMSVHSPGGGMVQGSRTVAAHLAAFGDWSDSEEERTVGVDGDGDGGGW